VQKNFLIDQIVVQIVEYAFHTVLNVTLCTQNYSNNFPLLKNLSVYMFLKKDTTISK